LNVEMDQTSLAVGLPLIASYVANQASRRSELMPIALEIRNSPPARRFRLWASRVQAAIDAQAPLQFIDNARRELDDLSSDLRKEVRLDRAPSTQVTVKFAVPWGFAIDIPLTVRAEFPPWLERIIHRRPHLKFLRDVARSMLEFQPFELAY